VYLVPFVEDEHTVFLKTIIPSRKATKQYLVSDPDPPLILSGLAHPPGLAC
jgi:hypothetical protein